jgi:hypothetical protein
MLAMENGGVSRVCEETFLPMKLHRHMYILPPSRKSVILTFEKTSNEECNFRK